MDVRSIYRFDGACAFCPGYEFRANPDKSELSTSFEVVPSAGGTYLVERPVSTRRSTITNGIGCCHRPRTRRGDPSTIPSFLRHSHSINAGGY